MHSSCSSDVASWFPLKQKGQVCYIVEPFFPADVADEEEVRLEPYTVTWSHTDSDFNRFGAVDGDLELYVR